MKVVGLDGKEYPWRLQKRDPRNKCSEPHKRARILLKQLFPSEVTLEEVFLPGSNKLTCDFYINGLKLMIEVHGEQHYTQSSHFHKDKRDFLIGRKRDRDKQEWCEINNIRYVELPHKEDDNEWKRRIIDGITT